MAQFTTNDGVLFPQCEDQGSGTPVVPVAGFRAAATSWLYQIPFLLDHGFRVITFDRRSHGRSEDPTYGHRMSRHGQDLAELLVAAGLTAGQNVVLIGGSMSTARSGPTSTCTAATESVRSSPSIRPPR